GPDGAARADIDAGVAAFLRRAAVRADLFPVAEKARLLELAHQRDELARRKRLLEGIGARREIALRQLLQADVRLAREIQDQVEALATRPLRPRKVDGADRLARRDALAMRLAAVHVDLVVVADRALRAGPHAGVAAGADLEVDRIFLAPFDVERAEPALQLRHPPRPHGIPALERQLAALAGNQHADLQLAREALGPVERRVGGPDDEEITAGLELDRRCRFRLGQRRHRHERG